jgi:DNA-binding NtrC family response regulator
MSDTWQVMVASSDLQSRRSLVSILDRQGLGTFCASNVSQCREILDSQNVGLVFCDRSFADGDYRDVLSAAAHRKPGARARVVLLHSLADSEQYRRAKEQGVFEVINSACRPTDVEWMVIQARRDEQKFAAGRLSASHGAVHEHSRSVGAS